MTRRRGGGCAATRYASVGEARGAKALVMLAMGSWLGATGCGHDHPSAPADVIYEAGATDEAWIAIDEAGDMVDDVQAPRLLTPTSPLSRATVPRFSWTSGPAPASRAPGHRGPASFARRLLEWMAEPVPTARAHLPPVTGPMYRLVVELGAGAPPIRVLTGDLAYSPSATVYPRIRDARGPLRVTIARAYLETGRVVEGPFVRSMPYVIELVD
ncbi:MAG: hypothetical protein NZ898_01820 [Myxococcota bacterium]|nr:hypothetical protein [Myxococcota bacterium]MDW8363073.1 hypothetical protein [Myxococcales bacterium]